MIKERNGIGPLFKSLGADFDLFKWGGESLQKRAALSSPTKTPAVDRRKYSNHLTFDIPSAKRSTSPAWLCSGMMDPARRHLQTCGSLVVAHSNSFEDVRQNPEEISCRALLSMSKKDTLSIFFPPLYAFFVQIRK